jgi:hypothetical protein
MIVIVINKYCLSMPQKMYFSSLHLLWFVLRIQFYKIIIYFSECLLHVTMNDDLQLMNVVYASGKLYFYAFYIVSKFQKNIKLLNYFSIIFTIEV